MLDESRINHGYLSIIDLDSPITIQDKTRAFLDVCRDAFGKRTKLTIFFSVIYALLIAGCFFGYEFSFGTKRKVFALVLFFLVLDGLGLYILFVLIPIKYGFEKKVARMERPHLSLTLGSIWNLLSTTKSASTYLPCNHKGPVYDSILSLPDLTCPTCHGNATSLLIQNGIFV